MILEAIFNVFVGALRLVLSPLWLLIPEPPSWLAAHSDSIAALWGYVEGFDSWIPVSLAFTVSGAILASYIVGWLVGLTRVIVSYLTLGGGST